MEISRQDFAHFLRSFLDGTCDEWDFDNYTAGSIKTPEVEECRVRLLELPDKYPPENSGEYCNIQGEQEIKRMISFLENH